MDYNAIGSCIIEVIKASLPIGIIFILGERIVQIFLNFAFPNVHKF